MVSRLSSTGRPILATPDSYPMIVQTETACRFAEWIFLYAYAVYILEDSDIGGLDVGRDAKYKLDQISNQNVCTMTLTTLVTYYKFFERFFDRRNKTVQPTFTCNKLANTMSKIDLSIDLSD